MRHTKFFLHFFLLAAVSVFGQTISEKKASLASGASGDLNREMQRFLLQVNNEIAEQKALLRELYGEVQLLYAAGAPQEEYRDVLDRINAVKDNIKILESSWRKMAAQNNQDEEYALWHQPDTTLGDLVIDFGSQDYVYLFSPEIGEMPVSVSSNIPIPRASWSEMLEMILNQNGIGINQVNPYLRQLYKLSEENLGVQLITDKRTDLELYPNETRVSFVVSPDPADVRRIWYFLDKFVNHQSTDLQMIGRDILIVATVGEVRELLKLYDFIAKGGKDSEYKIVPLHRVDAEEMGNILTAIFDQFMDLPEEEGERRSQYRGSNGLRVITLAHVARALFLIGTEEEINRAEEIIRQVESEVGVAREKIVYTYICKHADTEELADILAKVYALMVETGAGIAAADNDEVDVDMSTDIINVEKEFKTPQQLYTDGFYQEGGYIVNPAPVQPGITQQTNPFPNRGRNNFIVDPKTGAIVMVVDALALPKLKELIRKLDVPKKMVQIEVLLFEKKQDTKMRYGLNLLNIGSKASNTRQSAIVFNDPKVNAERGILDFFLSRMKSSSNPAFDLVYKFLLSQDDVSINANPTVLAMNQTTAMINVVDEISINTGIFEVETVKGVTLKDSFTRAQYGITIKVTPTVHMLGDEEGGGICCNSLYGEQEDYVTLETDITFETPENTVSNPDRPDVAIRHVQNTVRIPNGQAVILGGLRRKVKEDSKDSIPLLGEMPFFGKLFSETILNDKSTELFIMLTPTIVSDPGCELKQIRCQQMLRRPGDIPAYLCRLERAREREKHRLFEGYLTMLLGRPAEPCYYPPGEYDGRCR